MKRTKITYQMPRKITHVSRGEEHGQYPLIDTHLYKLAGNYIHRENEAKELMYIKNYIIFHNSKKYTNSTKSITISVKPYDLRLHGYAGFSDTQMEDVINDWIDIDLLTNCEYNLYNKRTGDLDNIVDKGPYFDILIQSLENCEDENLKQIPKKLFARFNKTKSARSALSA